MEGNDVYQLELALVCLCVARQPHVRITAPLIAETVLAERGSDGR